MSHLNEHANDDQFPNIIPDKTFLLTSKSGVPVMGCGRGLFAGGLHILLDREADKIESVFVEVREFLFLITNYRV